jgi:DNA-binding NarL/FixJ family response regulator
MGEPAQARTRATQALAAAGAPRQPLALLAAHRLLGELDLALGHLDAAEAQLAAALALADAGDAHHERALTLLGLAQLLQARGDTTAARAHLDTVRTLCTPMGAALTLAQADALDTRMRATPAARTRRPDGLTAREAEVLRLLATGLANAEIAEQLSLSPRTINAHLTTIYSKLGVATRGAAIRFALDHDLG